jgi:methylmalonyl-CoA/ethylmalonyl-CoA epimerase
MSSTRRASTQRVPEAVRGIGRVHHVALIVRSIEASFSVWRDALGLELETVMEIPDDRVRIAFLGVGESKIELVEPTDETTGADALLRLQIGGIELIDTVPRRGAEGPVAFLHPRACGGVLVELIEAPGGPAWVALGF